MSHYNANNVGYSPMTNHGEFGNAIPSQAQFMYYSAPPVPDALRTPPPYTNSHAALQESPMLRQQEQLVTNVQQPEQYSTQTGFHHHSQQASYTVPYAASRHHSMSYNMVSSLQNSQANSTSALNAHSASPQSQWIPPDPMHSHLNPSLSPTGQRYPSSSRYPVSMANTVQAQADSVNSQQNAMVPSALIGRYQGGMEIQNENFSSSSAVRLPQQAHQGIGQVSQSPNFVQTSHVSFMHMAQSYPLTQHSSTPNSAQYNQNQRIANQNFQQNKSTPSPQNLQMRYENVSPSTESHSNSTASFQVPQAKSHKPHVVQTLSRSQGASLNQLNRDSHIGHKMSSSFSVVNSRMPETSREMHSAVHSESFPTSFTNRQNSVKQSSVSDRRSSVPDRRSSVSDRRSSAPAVVPRSSGNFNGSSCENIMYLLQNDRIQSTETVRTGRSQEHSVEAGRMYRPETVNVGARSGQTASQGHSGVVSQGRGQGMVARGTGRGTIGKVATRGMVTKTPGRGLPMERGRVRTMREKVISNAVKASLTSDQSTYSPIQWYKHPDSTAPIYQSDIEAMRANVNSDQNLSHGVVQTSSSSQLNQRPNAIQVNIPPNIFHIGSLSTTQVKPNGTNQRNSLAETPSSNSTASSPLPLKSSHHSSLITRLHASPTLKERTSEGGERCRDITSMKQTAFRIKGEPSEAANVNSPPRGRNEDIANPECIRRPSPMAKPVGRMPSTDTTALSYSNAVSTVSAINSVSISKSTTSVSISSGVKDACQTMQRNMSVNENSSTQESSSAQRKFSPIPPTSTQASSSSTLSPHFSSLPSQKVTPNMGLPRKKAFEHVSGQSARDKVFSMWKAGQVVGRVPVKGKMKSKGQVSANALHKDNSSSMKGIPEKSDEGVCRISPEERDESALTTGRPCADQERAPFYALFHGHKIMCICSKQGNLVLVCQFLQDCFPDKGKGSVSNCINRALRIKKKLLEHPYKDKIITYLTNNGYILGKGEREPVHMINLDDARRVYHYMYKITNCSSASCVVQLEHQFVDLDAVVAKSKREKIIREKLRIIKKEKQSAEDKNYGKISQASNCSEIRKVSGKHPETNKLPVASDRNTSEKAAKRIFDFDDDDDEEDESDDLIIVEGPEDPYLIRSAVNEKLVGRVVNTVVGRVRSFHHKEDNYLVVPDLCGVLGYNEFMSVVEKDNVDLYSCCNDILSFLNSMQSGFENLTSGQNSLIKEKDIGSYSYDEDSTETETNMICPVKRVSCKQEIIDDEPECSAIKQPRLEPATHVTNNSSPYITSDASMTNYDSISTLSPFESVDNRKDLVTEAKSPIASSNDQDLENSNKRAQGRELSISETQAEENVSKISNKGSSVDEDETVMVFSTSCINGSKNSTHPVTQAKEDGEKVSSHITSLVNDSIDPVEMTEVASEKTKSPQNDEDTPIADVELMISEDPHGICAKSPVDVSSKGENESNDASMQNNSLSNNSIIVLISNKQNSSNGQTLQSVTPAHTSSSTDTHPNKSILTVIDNPHLYRSNSAPKEAVNSDTHSNKKDSAATAKSGHTISTELCSPQTVPTKVTDRRHTEPMVTLKATIPVNSVLKKSDKTSSNNAVISNVTPQQISLSPVHNKTGEPLSDSNKDVITPNFLAITETNPPSFSNATSTPSMPGIALSRINEKAITPGPKHRSSSCESSASCSSFLQVASSPSFKLRPKTATSALKYCPDDLELLSPRKSGTEAFKTKQALLGEMMVLRYKNKALQDMVKHLRRELLSSKDKNENNTKMIKYYENVLQEITASFKEGEPEVKESKEEQQQQQPTQTCGDSSAPILIDDD